MAILWASFFVRAGLLALLAYAGYQASSHHERFAEAIFTVLAVNQATMVAFLLMKRNFAETPSSEPLFTNPIEFVGCLFFCILPWTLPLAGLQTLIISWPVAFLLRIDRRKVDAFLAGGKESLASEFKS